MNDIATMQNIAELLYARADCKTAANIVQGQIANEQLRREQREMSATDEQFISVALFLAVLGIILVAVQ